VLNDLKTVLIESPVKDETSNPVMEDETNKKFYKQRSLKQNSSDNHANSVRKPLNLPWQ
jgi:hypothetical protein